MNEGRALLAILVAASPLAAGCSNDPKKLSAERMGDLTYVLQERVRPDAERVASCGDGALTDTGRTTLARRPYLQQLTTSSVDVLFRSSQPGAVVDITRPDGTSVGSFSAVEDTSNIDGAWQGIARIDGLEPATLYCYALRHLSDRAGFRTAPLADSGEKLQFIAFGDSGDASGTQLAVRDQMLTVPFDLILHTGDVAYDGGTTGQLESGFFRPYAELIAEFPSYLVAGNHDYATSGAAPFRRAFDLPENGGPEGLERWYSFDYGDVHFVGLDTERMGETQAEWLEQDLAGTDKPWKIVFAHRPPYSSGEHGSSAGFRTYFGPIIEKYGVQLVLNGHDHDYERTIPLAGTTYVVTGGGGRGTRPVGTSGFTAFSEDTLHFVQIEVGRNELIVHAIDGTGVEFDSARIERP